MPREITKFFDQEWREVPAAEATFARRLTYDDQGDLIASATFIAEGTETKAVDGYEPLVADADVEAAGGFYVGIDAPETGFDNGGDDEEWVEVAAEEELEVEDDDAGFFTIDDLEDEEWDDAEDDDDDGDDWEEDDEEEAFGPTDEDDWDDDDTEDE